MELENKQIELADAKVAHEKREAAKKAEEAKRKAQEEAARQEAEERAQREREQAEQQEQAVKQQQEQAEQQAREEQPKAPVDQTEPNDLDLSTDRKLIQSMIDKTHPKIEKPDLFDDIQMLWTKYEEKNDDMMQLLNRGIDTYGEVANEATRDVA